MFKKTLLAASILGGASFAANAGQIAVSVDEVRAATVTAVNAFDGEEDGCSDAATLLGVNVVLDGNALTSGGVQTFGAAAAPVADFAFTQSSVTLTAADTCTVVVGDALVGADSAKYSAEGAAANGVVLDVAFVSGVGGIAEENTVIFTVEGGTIDETLSATAQLVSDAGKGDFTLNGVVGNTILFSADPGYDTLPFEALNLKDVAIIPNAGVTEVTLSAVIQNTAALVVDTTEGAKVTNIANQYSASLVSGYDGIIDVSTERLSLEVNANDAFNTVGNKLTPAADQAVDEDTAVLKVSVATTEGNLVPTSGDLVIKGDFSWMADLDLSDDDTAITSAELLTGLSYASFMDDTYTTATPTAEDDAVTNVAINAEYNELTISLDPGANLDLDPYHLVGFKVPNGVLISPVVATTSLNVTDFEAGLTVKDGNDNEAVVLAADTKIGEWTLNGSVVTIPYMPFGPNTKVILRHTSTSNQIGDITVRYILEDLDPSNGDNWVSVGTVVTDVANGVLDIRDAVMDAIEADTGLDKGKVAIEITTNVPAADVTVYAAYNVKNSADDRGFVGTFGKLGSASVPQ